MATGIVVGRRQVCRSRSLVVPNVDYTVPMSWLRSPLVQITGLALAMTVLLPIAYVGAANLPGPLPFLVLGFAAYAVPITLVLWVPADMKDRGRTPPFDLPFLLLLVFPLSLFWYCIWTRGWQGMLLALGLYVVACLPAIATEFTRIALLVRAG